MNCLNENIFFSNLYLIVSLIKQIYLALYDKRGLLWLYTISVGSDIWLGIIGVGSLLNFDNTEIFNLMDLHFFAVLFY